MSQISTEIAEATPSLAVAESRSSETPAATAGGRGW